MVTHVHTQIKLFPKVFFNTVLLSILFALSLGVVHAQTPTPPPTCTLTTTPATIPLGASTRVQWASSNAQSGSITRIGNVPPSGIISLLPSTVGKTTFVGTFSNDAGVVTCSATVNVTSGQPNSNMTGGYDSSGYGPGDPQDPSKPTDTGTQAPGATPYTTGAGSDATPYSTNPYTIDPNAFKTNPTQSSFTGAQPPTVTNTPGNNTLSSYLVPCGIFSQNNLDSYNKQSTSCNICSFGQLIQNIINFMLLIAIPIAAGLFAWAGILRFTSNGNAAKVTQSNKIFSAVFIGFAIAISGYLIVQTLLNAFLTDNTYSWRTLSCPGTRLINSEIPEIFQGLYTPTGSSGLTSSGATGNAQLASGDCSPEALAQDWGSTALGNTFSCIARNESGCQSGAQNPSSTAGGRYQVVLGFNDQGHNLNFPSCTQAAQNAGYSIQGNLNCSTAFRSGRAIDASSDLARACRAAQSNDTCNTDAAKYLYANGGFSHWNSSAANQACISRYSGQ